MRTAVFVLILVFLAAVPLSAQKTEYQIGESEGGLLNDGKLKEAVQSAVDKFKDWAYEGVPSGYLTKTDDYYLQPYTDGEDRSAAVYVGSDYRAYVLRGPIYEQLDSIGGFGKLGRPRSDAHQVNGVWYQNFERGYATVSDDGKVSFNEGRWVDDKGVVSTDREETDGGNKTEDRTDLPGDRTDSSLSDKVSTAVSDVTDAVEKTASDWGAWVFLILLILAVAVLAFYWFLKRK